MTENKHKIFNSILILLPIIDLFTSLMTRFTDVSITVGVIVKGFMVVYFATYILFLTNSKYKKLARYFLISTFLYVIFYFLFKSDLLNLSFLVSELSYLFKLLFFPIMFVGLICFYDDSGFDKKNLNKIMLVNIILYGVLLFIPLITDSAFNTYLDKSKGFVGWYYSGNEISAVVVLLFPFLYQLIKSKKIVFIVALLITIFSISMIGTKVTLFGMFIVGILVLIISFFDKKNFKSSAVAFSLVAFIIIAVIMGNGYSVQNAHRIVESNDNLISIAIPEGNNLFVNKIISISLKLLSGRDAFILSTNKIYTDNLNVSTVLFGLGFSNTEKVNDIKITKLIEIDLLDIFYHTGIIGLLFALFPFFYTLGMLISCIYRKKAKFNKDLVFYGIMIMLSGGISCVSGHVLLDPAVSIYIVLIMMLLINELNVFKKREITPNKIQILSLHLGYGGGERACVDLANMLSEKYAVELISLYKTSSKCAFKVSDNVKIVYLTNLKPNREEFKLAVRKHNIFKILKEGFYAIYVLYMKYFKIRSFVEYSDAEYIISSRMYFSKILNKFGRCETKKVAIEHNYIVTSEFMKKLKLNLSNMDAIVSVSKQATKIYNDKNLNVIYIPNAVSSEYNIISDLSEKRLTYVGRLEEEKGVTDLIELMKIIKDKDKKITLDIIGDGTLKNKMMTLIKEYDLSNNITLHGFKDSLEIEEIFKHTGLFVLVSHKESFGIVLIEAMKCGIPCIAFDEATGAKDLIEDGKSGFLIKNRDMDAMANSIIDYFKMNKAKKDKLQQNAIKTSDKYTYDEIKKQWFKLMEQVKNKSN